MGMHCCPFICKHTRFAVVPYKYIVKREEINILTFPNGGARLELMQRPDTIDADPSKPNIGFIHVSFAVGSMETVDAKTFELRDAGYQVTSGPRTTGDGYYESCILGPEGIQIEITV